MSKKGVIPKWGEKNGRPRKHNEGVTKKQESYNNGKDWSKDWRRSEVYYSESELKRMYVKPQWDVNDIKQAYCDYYNGKYSYNYLCAKYHISKPTLKKYFALITYKIQLRDEEMAWRKHYREVQLERDRLLAEQRERERIEKQKEIDGKRKTDRTLRTIEDLCTEEGDRPRSNPEST